MRYFTNDPLERLMMRVPHYRRQTKLDIPESHPCYGCKRYGENCVLPCYRGVTVMPPIPAPDRSRSR